MSAVECDDREGIEAPGTVPRKNRHGIEQQKYLKLIMLSCLRALVSMR
jgi:hypothetical protein